MTKTKTLKDLRTYCEANTNNDWSDFFFNDGEFFPGRYKFLDRLLEVSFHPCKACNYKYAIDYEINDNGALMMHAYLQTDVDAHNKAFYAWLASNYDPELPEFKNHMMALDVVGEVKEQWCCEVPLSRGFSDTPERTDTQFSELDIDFATREAIEEHEGVHPIQEWELRDIMQSSGMIADLGLEESEVDDLISMFC